MNERGKDNHEQQDKKPYKDTSPDIHSLEKCISHFFDMQANQIYLKPELRSQILNQLSKSRHHQQERASLTILAVAAVFVIALAVLLSHLYTPSVTVIRYTTIKEINVAPILADGGQLISLDPTEQHIIYQPARQANTLYMANLSSAMQSNILVMRNEQDMAWAADGSALVATISTTQKAYPLLALVPQGQYMHLLGPEVQAANWSPINNNEIMYVQQNSQKMQLWSIGKSGTSATLQMQMQTSLYVQQMIWSSDGYHLALIVAGSPSKMGKAFKQPNSAIYMVDTHNNKLIQLVASGNFTIGTVAWSPDGQNLAYEQIDAARGILLKTLPILGQTKPASIALQHQLIGWSWAPDSKALVYSDSGVLKSYNFAHITRSFPTTQGELDSPFWLKNGQILCMRIINGKGKLAILAPQA